MTPILFLFFIQHCCLCQDGGNIWLCDEEDCGRGVCSNCIEIPVAELPKLKNPNVKFTCVPCHWLRCREESIVYYVSVCTRFIFYFIFIFIFIFLFIYLFFY
jgi:hypothetical protein